MLAKPAPSDQRVGVRPISFVLDNAGSIGSPVSLVIRPEDLTRTEPARATVHQTLGGATSGWVDHFGEGLPSVSISGHTGWRHSIGSGMDGAQAFEQLNDLVVHQFPAARQAAVDRGMDPAMVKLLFVDLLDRFAWSVVSTQFVLRRSKSRPLLFQYSINLQATATGVAFPSVVLPNLGTVAAGQESLGGVIGFLDGVLSSVEGWTASALSYVDAALGPVATAISRFVTMSNAVFGTVNSIIRAGQNLITSVANRLISVAHDFARVGLNVFRTVGSIIGLPAHLRSSIQRVASAFNEAVCIFRNSLRPRQTYEDYTGLYGASNCSSTTGGRPASAFANMNAFSLIEREPDVATLNGEALAGVRTLGIMDAVAAPLPFVEIGRHMTNIVTGTAL